MRRIHSRSFFLLWHSLCLCLNTRCAFFLGHASPKRRLDNQAASAGLELVPRHWHCKRSLPVARHQGGTRRCWISARARASQANPVGRHRQLHAEGVQCELLAQSYTRNASALNEYHASRGLKHAVPLVLPRPRSSEQVRHALVRHGRGPERQQRHRTHARGDVSRACKLRAVGERGSAWSSARSAQRQGLPPSRLC